MAGFLKSASLSGQLETYLSKWLAVATLENVVYDCVSENTGCVYFKCKNCQKFFKATMVSFAGGQIPYALQEWVKQHRHEKLPETPTLTSHIAQWLKTATKDNVALMSQMTGLAQKFYVFKCKRCLQNWHVGENLFVNDGIPSELQNWVKDHRHVCGHHSGALQNCANCGWPFGAHEESWNKQESAQQFQNAANSPEYQKYTALQQAFKQDWQNYWNKSPAPVEPPKHRIAPLPEPRGRKFRDVE